MPITKTERSAILANARSCGYHHEKGLTKGWWGTVWARVLVAAGVSREAKEGAYRGGQAAYRVGVKCLCHDCEPKAVAHAE